VDLGHRSTTKRAVKALEGLSLHADEEGRHSRSVSSLARIVGVRKDDVADTLHDLNTVAAVTI
jgi:hypothetical protein